MCAKASLVKLIRHRRQIHRRQFEVRDDAEIRCDTIALSEKEIERISFLQGLITVCCMIGLAKLCSLILPTLVEI
jgi:hypothetical protein